MPAQTLSAYSLVTFKNSQNENIRGTIIRLTRNTLILEIYSPYSVARVSEVLNNLTLRHNNHVIYNGRAVVTNIVNAGLMAIISATLVDSWLNIELTKNRPLQKEALDFINELNSNFNIKKGFRISIGEMRYFLSQTISWLENSLISHSDTTSVTHGYSSHAFNEISEPFIKELKIKLSRFEEEASLIPINEIEFHKLYTQHELHPLVLSAPFVYQAYSKPFGYAGDYKIVNMMVKNREEGPNIYSMIIHKLNLDLSIAVAHRNRINILENKITDTSKHAFNKNHCAHIISIGCGPAIEIQRFIKNQSLSNRCHFHILDFNKETIDYASNAIKSEIAKNHRSTFLTQAQLSVTDLIKSSSKGLNLHELDKYDLVYCAGLFDYLSDKIGNKLIEYFYKITRPGGKIIITNVHPQNPNRYALEFILDWFLMYRDENQLSTLAKEYKNTNVYTDSTGVNVFLEINKSYD